MNSGTRCDRHRDVVLDRAALVLLHLADAVAQCARTPSPASSEAAIAASRTIPAASASASVALGQLLRVRLAAAGGNFEQHVPGIGAGERIARAGQVVEHHLQRDRAASARSR